MIARHDFADPITTHKRQLWPVILLFALIWIDVWLATV